MQMPDVVRVNKYPEKESGDETTLREDIDVGDWFLSIRERNNRGFS